MSLRVNPEIDPESVMPNVAQLSRPLCEPDGTNLHFLKTPVSVLPVGLVGL
jgi:hypothetical protein